MNHSTFVFTGILLKENSRISALCTELDVASEGDTIAEAKDNLIEAVSLYIESAVENNLPIIRPVTDQENPANQNPDNLLEKFNIKIDFSVNVHA